MATPESSSPSPSLQGLRTDRSPRRDLWPQIAARLEPRQPTAAVRPSLEAVLPKRARSHRRRRWLPSLVACAALLLVAVLGVPRLQPVPPADPLQALDQLLVREAAALERQYAAAYAQFEHAPPPEALQPGLQALREETARVHAALMQNPRQLRLFDELRRLHERRLQLLMRSIEATA
jgi:hypothetical protein